MPTGPGLQANNLSPMGFGQPNMQRAASQQPGPGYGMPARPVAPGQQPQPKAPPQMGKPPAAAAVMAGIPGGLYQSPMGQDALRAKPPQPEFPANAAYDRIQSAILNPGPPRPPMASPPPVAMPQPSMGQGGTGAPPIGPGEVNLGGGPTPIGRPVMSPGLLGPAPMPQGQMPLGMTPGPMGPGGPQDMAAAMQWMQQQLGGQ
jgi:hypothetical protein